MGVCEMKFKAGDKVAINNKYKKTWYIGALGVIKNVINSEYYIVETAYGLDVFYCDEMELANDK